ncbi:hypothetical protein [Halomicrococcus sp. NG-SE-24]|uniref:hypothetical protein n=1 Tax=Halomicrococcus sp. NG-SE-24 TaxID=3436928 RepID=UPI003D97308C
MTDVPVIEPNYAVDQALEDNEFAADNESVRVLGFPKHLFEFHVEIDRKVLENRETTMSVTVDLLTGTTMKNDVYPTLESRSFSQESLLNPRVDRATAADKAHAQVRRRVNSWYKTFSTPEISISQDNQAFKLFWLVPSLASTSVTLVDTITGEVTARDVQVDEVTEESNVSSVN